LAIQCKEREGGQDSDSIHESPHMSVISYYMGFWSVSFLFHTICVFVLCMYVNVVCVCVYVLCVCM